MTGLLTAAAIIATLTLLVSATRTGSQVTAAGSEQTRHMGYRPLALAAQPKLDPHERRWQTNAAFWQRQLVALGHGD